MKVKIGYGITLIKFYTNKALQLIVYVMKFPSEKKKLNLIKTIYFIAHSQTETQPNIT